MPHCKACDAVLEPYEIVFDTVTGEHEDLCKKCIGAIFEVEDEIDELYNTPYNYNKDY